MTRGPRTWSLEALVPFALLVARCFLPIATPLYLDWIVVFCLYWILFVFLSGSRWMEGVTTAAALLMLGLYLCRTIPALMDTLLHSL